MLPIKQGKTPMQSKKSSLLEVFISTFIGLLIALSAQMLYFWYQNINVTLEQNVYMSIFMTIVSVARQYIIRRIFNKHIAKKIASEKYQEREKLFSCAIKP